MGKTLNKFLGFKTSNIFKKSFMNELFTTKIKSSKTKLLNNILYLKIKEIINTTKAPNTNSLFLTFNN